MVKRTRISRNADSGFGFPSLALDMNPVVDIISFF